MKKIFIILSTLLAGVLLADYSFNGYVFSASEVQSLKNKNSELLEKARQMEPILMSNGNYVLPAVFVTNAIKDPYWKDWSNALVLLQKKRAPVMVRITPISTNSP